MNATVFAAILLISSGSRLHRRRANLRRRRFLAELDAILAAIEAQDDRHDAYDGFLPPGDRYQGD